MDWRCFNARPMQRAPYRPYRIVTASICSISNGRWVCVGRPMASQAPLTVSREAECTSEHAMALWLIHGAPEQRLLRPLRACQYLLASKSVELGLIRQTYRDACWTGILRLQSFWRRVPNMSIGELRRYATDYCSCLIHGTCMHMLKLKT